jgi:GNAT superfamily N-acetyltransferase
MTPPVDELRLLRFQDLARCVELSAEVGWNQNEGDWRFLLQHGVGYGIERGQLGLVATTMAWPMGEAFSWINMVIVKQECRGQGLARTLLSRCLADTAARGQVALLDATDAGSDVYGALDFAGSERVVRLWRSGDSFDFVRNEPLPPGWSVDLADDADLIALRALDQKVVGADRGTLIEAWFVRDPQAAQVLRDQTGKIRGFLLGRGGRTARQLGPLVVESARHARMLVTRALRQLSGPVLIDVPEVHLAWLGELHQWGFEPQRRFKRMGLHGASLPTKWSGYFATAGPEFG